MWEYKFAGKNVAEETMRQGNRFLAVQYYKEAGYPALGALLSGSQNEPMLVMQEIPQLGPGKIEAAVRSSELARLETMLTKLMQTEKFRNFVKKLVRL